MLHALHGNFGSPADWDAVLSGLSTPVPVRCWNLWEIRRRHPEAATLEGFARWLNHQASQEVKTGSDPRILAGYSLGGRLALQALTLRPDLWQAAILLGPHPGLEAPAERYARLRHDQTWADYTRQAPWPELLTDWNTQPVLAGGPAPSAAEEWRSEIAGAFEDWSLGHQAGGLMASLAGNPVPVLWITGEQDVKFTALGAAAACVVPLIRHHILPGCGHRLLQQDPQAVRALVSGFLNSLPSASLLS
ncbi:MAG: hypothetical protein JWM59_3980 [Verrucomicrobiales bacterium]|nr:hypothetical protein [Verrucomicrobiales bacterium]